MRITRLAALGAVSGAVTLIVAGPAQAAPANVPEVTVTGPADFVPGDNLELWVLATKSGDKLPCDEPPTSEFLPNEIFAENPVFLKEDRVGKSWHNSAGTKTTLKVGTTYETTFQCRVGTRHPRFTMSFTVPKAPPTTKPTNSPSPKPKFQFGFDKVQLSTRTVTPKSKIDFTVTCPSVVTAESASFTATPKFKKSAKDTFKATGVFKKTLPSVVTIKVTCKDYGTVTFSTQPGKDSIGNGGPKIPKGAPDTGDGSTLGGGGGLALGGGAAVALAGAGLGAVALRRRAKGSRENA